MQRRTHSKQRSPHWTRLLGCVVLVALGVVIGLLMRQRAPQPATGEAFGSDQRSAAPTAQLESIADMAERVMPAVVPVTIEFTMQRRRGGTSLEELSGSGSYIDARGLVLTNEHVVDEAVSVQVVYRGQIIPITNYAINKDLDLAVLDVGDAMSEAVPIPFGDSSALRIGEEAIIIGYPNTGDDALGETLTTGVISGLHATDDPKAGSLNAGMIQTDAAINNGNSGGALLNRRGELVGIPTAKMQSGYGMQFEGLGFATPVTENMDAIQALMDEVLGNR